jgi:hypothetical protein
MEDGLTARADADDDAYPFMMPSLAAIDAGRAMVEEGCVGVISASVGGSLGMIAKWIGARGQMPHDEDEVVDHLIDFDVACRRDRRGNQSRRPFSTRLLPRHTVSRRLKHVERTYRVA